MTVTELKERLEELESHGHGRATVLVHGAGSALLDEIVMGNWDESFWESLDDLHEDETMNVNAIRLEG